MTEHTITTNELPFNGLQEGLDTFRNYGVSGVLDIKKTYENMGVMWSEGKEAFEKMMNEIYHHDLIDKHIKYCEKHLRLPYTLKRYWE